MTRSTVNVKLAPMPVIVHEHLLYSARRPSAGGADETVAVPEEVTAMFPTLYQTVPSGLCCNVMVIDGNVPLAAVILTNIPQSAILPVPNEVVLPLPVSVAEG